MKVEVAEIGPANGEKFESKSSVLRRSAMASGSSSNLGRNTSFASQVQEAKTNHKFAGVEKDLTKTRRIATFAMFGAVAAAGIMYVVGVRCMWGERERRDSVD